MSGSKSNFATEDSGVRVNCQAGRANSLRASSSRAIRTTELRTNLAKSSSLSRGGEREA